MTTVSYRLSLEHLHPDGLDDRSNAVRWVAKSGQNDLGINQHTLHARHSTDIQAVGQILRPL